jgi:2-polyprenyl-6-methoxyphenol hydroxylase-like FAD-dependent oxidoreductase
MSANDTTGGWFSNYTLTHCPDDWRQIDLSDAKKQLQTRHKGWKNQAIQRLIYDTEIIGLWPTFTTPLLPTWEKDGCVLVGDAAHALQPSSGQGASMALEDAETLALLLAHHVSRHGREGCAIACKQYAEIRMPRLAMVHTKAQQTASLKQDMNAVEEMLMYFFIWLMGGCTP